MSPFTKVKMSPYVEAESGQNLQHECQRDTEAEIMSQLARKQITQIEAAKRLGISVQQGASGNQRKNKETVF